MKQSNNSNNGFLVVFEGIDGSGKTTQIKLLAKLLKVKKTPFEVISFPQYGKNEYAKKILDYLSGKFGKLAEVDPYTIAKLYAGDRKTAKDKIKNWLKSSKMVIANRYVSSSKAHLGTNIDESKRNQFIKWLDKLEYKTNQMPKEDLTILLVVNPKIAQKNAGAHDIHEESLNHLQKTSEIFLQLFQTEKKWLAIDCMENREMRAPQEIHQEITSHLKKKLFQNKVMG